MARADRLLELLDLLRRHRGPVTGARLAEELGVSLRSLYRDIDALRGRGAEIEGEAGFGYVLKPGFLLPPLMFSREEIEALVLGSRWVAKRGDAALAAAAAKALAKIKSVLPAELRDEADAAGLMVGPAEALSERIDLGLVREAIRRERKLVIAYEDKRAFASQRTVWPFALAIRAGLFRPPAHDRRLVRTAPGFSPFPHRPDRLARGPGGALSAPPRGFVEGLARGRGRAGSVSEAALDR